MTDVLCEIRKGIEKRIKDYEKADEKHMNKIMDLQAEITELMSKRKKAQELIKEAEIELNKLNDYEKYTKM